MRRIVPVLLALSISGCGAATATTVGTAIAVGETVVAATCTGADKLCESRDPACGSAACHVAHDVCATLSPSSPVQLSCSAH